MISQQVMGSLFPLPVSLCFFLKESLCLTISFNLAARLFMGGMA
jgi:hypothetical protein